MTRLLCTGDLHLGRGADLGRHPGDRLRDQGHVLGQIVQLATEREVDGILVAGDVFEGPGIPPEQLELFACFVQQCRAREIPILSIVGNGKHDAAMRETNGLAIFDHVPGIDVHPHAGWVEFAGCAIAMLPWVSPARLVAARNGGDRDEINADVAQLLVEVAADLDRTIAAMPISKDLPRILLAHWSVSGSSLPTGLPVDQLREPVIPLADLEQLGYDAIVLGHIHRPQLFGCEDADAPIFYVGSPLPLNFGEADTAHGVTILEFPGGGEWSTSFQPIESRPLVTLDVDITGDTETSGLAYVDVGYAAKEHDLHDAIVRVRYRATAEQHRRIDSPGLRRELLAAGAHVVRLQPEIVRTERARVEGLDEQVDELAALDLYIDANGVASDLAGRMRERMREYIEAGA